MMMGTSKDWPVEITRSNSTDIIGRQHVTHTSENQDTGAITGAVLVDSEGKTRCLPAGASDSVAQRRQPQQRKAYWPAPQQERSA